jgi:hypothetical protein
MERRRLMPIVCWSLALTLVGGLALAQTPPSTARITELINTVKTSQILGDRYIAAQELPNVTAQMEPARIPDATVGAITALLSSEEIFVVHYAALSLASMGPRAARAIPQLQAAFGRVRQLRAQAGFRVNPQGAEEGLCLALERTGAPNPPECRDGQFQY